MPLVVVYGLTDMDYESDRIGRIEECIIDAVLSLPEIELTYDDISFSFPRDPSVGSDKVPVAIIVELLFDKPKRTLEVRHRLAEKIGVAFKETVTTWRRLASPLEVAVKRFDPDKDGFYTDVS